MGTWKSAAFAALIFLPLAGCVSRVVVIDSASDVVRLGPNVRGSVYVWQDGKWVRTGNVRLPEGWYAGPGPQ